MRQSCGWHTSWWLTMKAYHFYNHQYNLDINFSLNHYIAWRLMCICSVLQSEIATLCVLTATVQGSQGVMGELCMPLKKKKVTCTGHRFPKSMRALGLGFREQQPSVIPLLYAYEEYL